MNMNEGMIEGCSLHQELSLLDTERFIDKKKGEIENLGPTQQQFFGILSQYENGLTVNEFLLLGVTKLKRHCIYEVLRKLRKKGLLYSKDEKDDRKRRVIRFFVTDDAREILLALQLKEAFQTRSESIHIRSKLESPEMSLHAGINVAKLGVLENKKEEVDYD